MGTPGYSSGRFDAAFSNWVAMVTMINFSKEIKVFYDIPRDFSEIYDAVRRVIVPLNPS